jgi:inorganic pyrophosphatase
VRLSQKRTEKEKKKKDGTRGGADGGRERNDRIVAVACADRRRADLADARDLPERDRAEIEQFFLAAAALEGKDLEVLGWRGAKDARRSIDEAFGRTARAGGTSRVRGRGRAGGRRRAGGRSRGSKDPDRSSKAMR